jgi:putative beta-barrel porin BBP2
VTGRAHVGFQKFTPLDSTVPAFAGVAADVELGYTLLNTTRLTVRADRDIAYSYEITEPYYVRTGLSGAMARHVRGQWEVIGNIGRQRLDYQSIRVVTAPSTNTQRSDVVSNYGTGVAYRLNRSKRVELKLDYYRRRSPVAVYRDYDGFRLSTSVTYGLR